MIAHSVNTPFRLLLCTFPSALRLFALVTVDLQLSPSVSLYLLFHKNWRSVPMQDPLLRRSVMKTLSNRFGGTQGTLAHDNHWIKLIICPYITAFSLSASLCLRVLNPHEKKFWQATWSSRLLVPAIMDPQRLPPLRVPSPSRNPDSLVVPSTQPRVGKNFFTIFFKVFFCKKMSIAIF